MRISEWISRGAIPVAAYPSCDIAEAPPGPDEQGIIYCVIENANIKVRPDGTVKVSDFGLAKAIGPIGSAPDSGSRRRTHAATDDGRRCHFCNGGLDRPSRPKGKNRLQARGYFGPSEPCCSRC